MDPEDQRPNAEAADVNSPSAIVEAAYDVIPVRRAKNGIETDFARCSCQIHA